MNAPLRFGYSPCPNDTYIFHALAAGLADTAPFAFDIFLADVEELNKRAVKGEPDLCKVSAQVVAELQQSYAVLRCGGAMGRGVGPLVVTNRPLCIEELRDKPIAVPGLRTTANRLLSLHGLLKGPRVEMRYDEIMPALQEGRLEAGVIIHEGRFTYERHGLHKAVELGAWWESDTGLPLPLGVIVMKKSYGEDAHKRVEEIIRASLTYARAHPEASREYIREHAQEMEPEVIRQHIETFVNDYSMDMGKEGERALARLLEKE